ncbi:hypothetical protein LCGC14_2099240, partial [marine sediment metagenome]
MEFRNLRIGTKLGAGFGVIIALMVTVVVVTGLYLKQVDYNANFVKVESLPFMITSGEMAMGVVQVQQWLTDVSATHDPGGYEDAEDAAEVMRDGLESFRVMFREENDSNALREMDEMGREFEKFYELGLHMAKTYIDEGVEAGNVIMQDFDVESARITQMVTDLQRTQIDEGNFMTGEIVNSVTAVNRIMLSLAVIALVLGILIAAFISRSITVPLAKGVVFSGAIAKGDLMANVDVDQKDEVGELAASLNNMQGTIKKVLNETNTLIKDTQDGKLDSRTETKGYEGAWDEMVTGLNNLIEAFVRPFKMTAQYVERISIGDTPERITEEYRGDFNDIKKNLNSLIKATDNVTDLTEKIAKGDLTVKATERSENDKMMKALNSMVSG